jgi:hypothetical protein
VKAKAAARFYGRQGGRFAEAGAENGWIFELHAARLRELAKGPKSDTNPKGGTWPSSSLAEWQQIAERARARDEGITPSAREAMALDVVDVAEREGWLPA